MFENNQFPSINITNFSLLNSIDLESVYNLISINKIDMLNKTGVLVNYNNIDIGFVLISIDKDKTCCISIHRFPRICRMSIISLIEAAVVFIKELDLKDIKVYKFVNTYLYSFKLKIMFKEFIELGSDVIEVKSNVIDSLNIKQITTKNININLK